MCGGEGSWGGGAGTLSPADVGLAGGCGGGGGKTSVTSINQINSTVSSVPAKELMFQFAIDPLQPRVFNLKSTDTLLSGHFFPGDVLNIIWNINLYYSDNSTFGASEKYLYDAKVYLSNDRTLDQAGDLKLFSSECSIPGTAAYSCTENASFQCVYAMDNLNTFSCTSIPINKEKGFKDVVVDSSTFLTSIPKSANIIIKNCLKDNPDKCINVSVTIQLN